MRILTFVLIYLIACGACTQQTKETPVQLTSLNAPSGKNASLPYLIEGQDGALYLSWVEKGDSNSTELKYSRFNGDAWSDPALIASGSDWFVNWADYPMLAIDRDGNKIAHFLAKSASGTYAYDVNVVIKPRGSENWSDPIVPHKDETATEHGFVTMLPQNDGTFLLAWLDGRYTGGSDHDSHEGSGAMTLRTATIDMEGILTEEAELDQKICDCCQTSGVMLASGPVIAYRDRSDEEIRDISFVSKNGDGWTTPKNLGDDNWNITGCPVNGPRLAAVGDQVVAAWFTAAGDKPTVKAAYLDGDIKSIIIDEHQPLGRVDVVALDDQSAMVSWLGKRNGTAMIMARRINSDGLLGEVTTIAETSVSRASGFPQMAVFKESTYFAWTHIDGESSAIRVAKLSL